MKITLSDKEFNEFKENYLLENEQPKFRWRLSEEEVRAAWEKQGLGRERQNYCMMLLFCLSPKIKKLTNHSQIMQECGWHGEKYDN